MFRWIPYAFVRIVIVFCAGIVLALYNPDLIPERPAQLLLCGFVILYLLLIVFRLRTKINPGFIGLITISLTGFVAVQLKTESRHPDHIMHVQDTITFYSVVITRPAEEKEKTWKQEAFIDQIKTKAWLPRKGKVLMYFSKAVYQQPFRYGDRLIIKGSPDRVKRPMNPGEYDYRQFLSYKQIYHQAFVREQAVVFIGNSPPDMFIHYALLGRQWSEGVLNKFISGKREQGLASALVLGVTDGLDNELLSAYAATGAMHILSVSGLHVGVIYWMVLLLAKPFERFKATKWILAMISLMVLWGYAFMTGVSPSVLRAVMMFSFVAIARPWNWKNNIYNSLASSAFFLLLYDPFMIMSVGFQLSYLAVIGIVSLQPTLYRIWEPQNRLLDEIWKVSAVSIAAQLATFSLGLLYFHQFPNYFLIANLLVIPGSFIILVMGVMMLVLGAVEPIGHALGWLLTWTMKLMNEFVFFVEKIPFSLIDGVQINIIQCLLLSGSIIFGYVWIETKRPKWLVAIAVTFIIFSFAQWLHYDRDIAIEKMTVYHVAGHTAVDFSAYGKSVFLADSALWRDTGKIKFHLQPSRVKAGIRQVSDVRLASREFEGCRLMTKGGKTILQVYSSDFHWTTSIPLDFLIVSNNAVKDLPSALVIVNTKHIILDSSNTFRNSEKLLQQAHVLNFNVFSVLHHGAFEITL